MHLRKLSIAFVLFVVAAFSQTLFAQGLNWEGQTGALITPFAYTASSPAAKFGRPEVAFHYLNTGSVIGNDYQFSVTEGVAKHFEFGFTEALSSSGNVGAGTSGALGISSSPTKAPSFLFSNGFSELHGKLTFVNENAFKTKFIPAIAVGAIGRFGAQRATSFVTSTYSTPGATDKNGDFYIVATKTITQVKGLPFVLSFGEKVTNASVFGIVGNAGSGPASASAPLGNSDQRWQGRLFGAAAFVVKGPAKSALILGSEFAQQPRYVQGIPKLATVPTTMSYFVRVVPHLEGSPLQVDVGVAQVAGKIVNLPGVAVVDLAARAQVGMGVSYHF
jgi:hypothetical protein